MGFKELIIGVILVGLFSLSLLTFSGNIQLNNNVTTKVLDDPSLSGFNKSLSDNLGLIQSDAQKKREALQSQKAQGSSDVFSLTSIPAIVTGFIGTGVGTLNLVTNLLSDVLGIPPIVFTIIMGVFILSLIIFAWRVIRGNGT